MDTLDALKIFVRVAEAGSFAQAARQLDLAPATATRAVQALEERLSARLFHRNSRSVRLTEAGELYLAAVRPALAGLFATEDALRAARARQITGTLRLTMPTGLGTRHLVPLLAQFREAHPGLRLDLDFSDGAVDLVTAGFDAAIRVAMRLPDSSFSARPIGSSPVVVTGSPGYLARHGTPLSVPDLTRHVCVHYAHWFGGPSDTHRDAAGALVRVNSGAALGAFAVAGLGLIRTPAFVVADEVARGNLVQVLPEADLGRYVVHVVFPERSFMPLRLRSLIDFLHARLGDLGLPGTPGRPALRVVA